jgi:hypothetical protein|tara:strand:+ start:465 stop:668 length:204 start_codon:yes stop_codon:yes gene_type:complete
MKNYFIIFILIFLVNCSFNRGEQGITRNNISQIDINSSKEYSFEEYVKLLLNKNKSKKYPDINNFPD